MVCQTRRIDCKVLTERIKAGEFERENHVVGVKAKERELSEAVCLYRMLTLPTHFFFVALESNLAEGFLCAPGSYHKSLRFPKS